MKAWKWNNAKTNPPKNNNDVLISDGNGSFVVAWYDLDSKTWNTSIDLLTYNSFLNPNSESILEWIEIVPNKDDYEK